MIQGRSLLKLFLVPLVALIPLASAGGAVIETDFAGRNRPLLIFAPAGHPTTELQKQHFQKEEGFLSDLDILPWTVVGNEVTPVYGKQRMNLSAVLLRKALKVRDSDFRVILIGKDGEVKFRAGSQVAVTDLEAVLDSPALRREELKNQQ